EGEVVVSIDEKEDGWWVTVSDQGIGMTLDTVRNYFLKAGASLRRSEIWRKTFENEENKSQVLRSGRFGIGVLAAYLLGGEVHVSTRHVGESADNGIMFSGELDAEMIELQKIRRPIGTTVRVRISDKVKEELLGEWDGKIEEWSNQDKWDWYCLTNPEVIRTVNGSNALQQTFQLPPINSELPVGWHRIRHPDYQDIHWTYLEAPKLTCNGIIIVDSSVFESVIFRKEDFGIKDPRISIFDYDANLPLNVQRTALTQKEYPFRKVLLLDALKDYIAFLIVNAPSKPVLNKSNLEWISKDDYPGKGRRKNYFYYDPFDTEDVYLFPWFFTKFGISFVDDPWHVNGIKTNSALLLQFYSQEYKFIPNIVPYSFQAVFVSSIERSHSYSKVGQAEALDVAISFALGKLCYYEDGDYYGILKYFLTRGKRMLVSCHVLRQIQKVAKFEQKDILSQELNSQLKKEWRNENWILLRLGDCPSPEFDFEKFATENDGKNYDEWPCILAEWYFKDKKPKFKMSQLAKVWRDLIGSPVIPYDLEERRQMKAYKELKPYIEAHEKLKSK
ncbi:MAG: hypothetical protein GY749_10975, partial [Desulfobacteraceae bacterium]|nr:hypothetical protein [Desulfobacteraceae bacterium]